MVLASSSSSSKAIFAFQRPSSVFLLLFLTAVFLLSLANPAMIPVLGVALTDRDDDDDVIIIIGIPLFLCVCFCVTYK